MRILKCLFVFTISSMLFVACKAEPLEGDEEAPLIEIIKPNDNAIFYTSDSGFSPSSIEIHARATDNNAVVFGIFTITDADGNLVDADVESSFSENNTVLDLTANFSIDTPGSYTINFLFRDANDNNASTTRTIQCVVGESEEEEEEQAIVFQMFFSDRQHASINKLDIYNDGTAKEIILSKDVTKGKSLVVYPEFNELLVGSTESGLDVNITSVNPSAGGRDIKNVSISNYLFSALVKNQTEQEVYYFLEGADLTKVARHRLYKMNADGTNQVLLGQIENATRANAIKKIWVQETENPFLIMHDRHALYAYNPDSEASLQSSTIFTTDGHEIHDIAVDLPNKTIYMILSYNRGSQRYYTIGTSNLEGTETNLNFIEIAGNHPTTSSRFPHRMKLDVKNQMVYWLAQSEDLQKSILKRASFNDSSVQTVWETGTCVCVGEVEDIRIEDYYINTESIIVTN
ncbi:Ig-like domain-containing protein [Cognatitamlana onchidii]|uniref:Ig-like domain-containing protein n=1 Tax=Cognatitamlana onchidii TaxID=2562860 RepID=UPI0010A6547F|nr:Ig-like domain-containing protein [Algibacter onchidii]